MTPDKGKRPLPTSTSFVIPEDPSTYRQWKIVLQWVKILYLKGKWKECIGRCRHFLHESQGIRCLLHTATLHFLCALSNEAVARSAHSLSTIKLQHLKQAKDSYEAAALTLPEPIETLEPQETYSDDTESIYSSTSAESEILDYYQSSLCSSKPHDGDSSPSSLESPGYYQDVTNKTLKPSPLRIRKPSTSCLEPWTENKAHPLISFTSNQPPDTPPPKSRLPTPPYSRLTSIHFTPQATTWLRTLSYERYNAHLHSFTDMLKNHICAVEGLIVKTQKVQAERYFAKRLVSYGEEELAKAVDLQARIARLKVAGWRRERFRPERYQELCASALEEI